MAFKWSEDEIQKVADSMYKLMSKHGSSYTDWSAFKYAQAIVNPVYKYSTSFQNTKLMKELRHRIAQIFADCKNKIEIFVVLDPAAAKAKAKGIMEKIGKHGLSPERKKDIDDAKIEALAAHIEKLRKTKEKPKTRKLLTGNVVENLNHQVTISITTSCPRKWVLVDLETGDQYGSTGVPTTLEMKFLEKRQTWTNPIRRVTIPKPKKSKVKQEGADPTPFVKHCETGKCTDWCGMC